MTAREAEKRLAGNRAKFEAVAALLGAPQTMRKVPQSAIEAHDMLLQGMPTKALTHLVQNLVIIDWDDAFAKAVGMSERTFQRHTTAAAKALSPEQSGRAWKFAEILAQASAVFGSKEDGEQWLEQPAVGLDGRRPIDLLATPAGVELVEDFLVRLEYGVYA